MNSDKQKKHLHGRDVFSAEKAEHLDTNFRRKLYRPDKLAIRYVKPGDKVLDFGCGPGFFTREFAIQVGEKGEVYSVDLQDKMLDILIGKMKIDGLIQRIRTHQCKPDSINLPESLNGTFDAVFAIFVVHEVPEPKRLFSEIIALLKPGGTFFYSEPPFLVSGKEFQENIRMAKSLGFIEEKRTMFFVNRAVLLRKEMLCNNSL